MKYAIEQTEIFAKSFRKMRDLNARAAIRNRLVKVEAGNLGNIKSVGGRVSEMKIDVGQGYRVYFTLRENVIVLLLCMGDKSSQANDIKLARSIEEKIK